MNNQTVVYINPVDKRHKESGMDTGHTTRLRLGPGCSLSPVKLALTFASKCKFRIFERPVLWMLRAVPYHPGDCRNSLSKVFGLAASRPARRSVPDTDDPFLKLHNIIPTILNMQAQQGRSSVSTKRGKSEGKRGFLDRLSLHRCLRQTRPCCGIDDLLMAKKQTVLQLGRQ